MRVMTVKRMLPAAVAALALLASGCAPAGGPVNLMPSHSPKPPMPAGTQIGEDALHRAPDQDTSCGDPTVSLAPKPAAAHGPTVRAIRDRDVLRVGVDNSTYLLGFRDPNSGELRGFDIGIAHDMARAILGDPDKVRFEEIDAAQRVTALRRDDVDMVVRTMTITCDRRDDVAFSAPYFTAKQRILVPAGSAVEGMTDLSGKRVCAVAGSTGLATIASTPGEPVPVSVTNWSDCLVLLQQHQVAAISAGDVILAGIQAQDPGVKIVGSDLATQPYGIAMSKDATDLVRFVNGELQAMRHNGTWHRLYTKWIGDRLGRPAHLPAARYKGKGAS